MDTTVASRELLAAVPAASWRALAARRVWFGHQSVGGNIMQGVADLVAGGSAPIPRPVNPTSPLPAGFAHALNGQNMKPDSKIAAFRHAIDDELKGQVDIAFFKFCYVDIDASTNVAALFSDYQQCMDSLSAKYPSVRFVHVTCPMTTVSPGWRAALKRVLGKPSRDFEINAAREAFSQRLRDSYGGRQPIFDLATVESTYPNGRRRTFRYDGRVYPALVEGYSDDGRHLDANGRRWAAAHLLSTLATVAAKP